MRRKSIRQPSIFVLGDINVDIMGRVKTWPEPGEDCLAQKLEIRCGGVGANCALGLAGWGVSAQLVGCVGQDIFSDYVLKVLEANKVDVRCVQRTGAAMTGMFYINVTPDGERTFFGGRGANARLRVPPRKAGLTTAAAAAHIAGHSFLDRGPAQVRQTSDQSHPRARRLGFARRRYGAEQIHSAENFANGPPRGYSAG